jgi:hypothetical protein
LRRSGAARVQARHEAVGERSQDVHLMGAPGGKQSPDSAWAYMRSLLALSGLPPSDCSHWLQRMELVQSIYQDRVERAPTLPWEDDAYRSVEYHLHVISIQTEILT